MIDATAGHAFDSEQESLISAEELLTFATNAAMLLASSLEEALMVETTLRIIGDLAATQREPQQNAVVIGRDKLQDLVDQQLHALTQAETCESDQHRPQAKPLLQPSSLPEHTLPSRAEPMPLAVAGSMLEPQSLPSSTATSSTTLPVSERRAPVARAHTERRVPDSHLCLGIRFDWHHRDVQAKSGAQLASSSARSSPSLPGQAMGMSAAARRGAPMTAPDDLASVLQAAGGDTNKPELWQTDGHPWLHLSVRRWFAGLGLVRARVERWLPPVGLDPPLWHIAHADGDEEDLEMHEVGDSLVMAVLEPVTSASGSDSVTVDSTSDGESIPALTTPAEIAAAVARLPTTNLLVRVEGALASRTQVCRVRIGVVVREVCASRKVVSPDDV